jgi:conjugal transfer/entry exclusion protein
VDKDKQIQLLQNKIKLLEDLLTEANEENKLLWDYLDEVRENEKALMKEIQLAVDHYVVTKMKPVGDA